MSEYAVYLRKSRADMEAEARGEGETLARHQTQLLEYAQKHGLQIGAIYKELVSGESIAARPVMQQLMQEVSDGRWDGVICMEIERLARGDTMDQGLVSQTFKYSGTKIVTPTKTYDPNNEFDEEYFEFSLFMSRREYKTIRRRMQAGRLASVREGNYIGSLPPYGYRKIRNYENSAFTLEPIEEEANTVKLMFDLFVNQNMGYSKIATYLNNLGIPPKRVDVWNASSVKGIIDNPIYCGKLRWDWRKTKKLLVDGKIKMSRPRSDGCIYQGKHPPIISEELWQAAQAVPSKAPHSSDCFSKPVKNYFVGLMYCGLCNHAMTRRPYPNKPDQYICTHNGCNCMSSWVTDIDDALMQSLKSQYARYQLMLRNGAEPPPDDNAVIRKSAETELEKLKKQQSKLYDLLEQGVYTTAVFLERQTDISKRMQEAGNILANAEPPKNVIAPEDACVVLKNIIDDYYNVTDPTEKNKLLKTAIKRINYTKTTGGRYNPSDLALTVEYIF